MSERKKSNLIPVIPVSYTHLDQGKLSEELKKSGEFRLEDRPIGYLDGMPAYTDVLERHGYTCALSGKWHLGDSLRPQHGFSKWYTIGRGGCHYMRPEDVYKRQPIILFC